MSFVVNAAATLRIAILAGFAALILGLSGAALAAGGDDDWGSNKKDADMAAAVKQVEAENYAGAIPLLEKAIKTNPRNADAFNLLAFSQRKLGDYDSAAKNYQTALAIDPDHKGALEYQGELFLTLGQPQQAQANLDRLDRLCFFGCSEYRELKQAIADYKAKQSS